MNKKETGEFIFRFYRKRATSFLANLYKASITGDDEDIHKARVDVKKIIALFRLFEMILPNVFQKDDHYYLFQKLFSITGKIRESQVNVLLLGDYFKGDPETNKYKSFIKAEVTRLTRQFLLTVQKVEDRNLKKTEIEIRRLGAKIGQKKFISVAYKFILKKALKTKKILIEKKSPEYLHKDRQNLKAIGAIAALSKTIKRDKKLDHILHDLTNLEVLIGKWHDKQVFIRSINAFIKKKGKIQKTGFPLMKGLKNQMIEDCNILQKKITPELKQLLTTILDSQKINITEPQTEKNGGAE